MKNILIVEDDEFFRGLISKEITAEGFNVSMAVDGQEAIDKIKKEKPDLVLLDLLLPTLDGFEVLFAAKQDQNTLSIPIIALSNLDQKENVDRALRLGAADYLVKSQSNIIDIIEKVKKTLEKK